jgi:hypothetical protein
MLVEFYVPFIELYVVPAIAACGGGENVALLCVALASLIAVYCAPLCPHAVRNDMFFLLIYIYHCCVIDVQRGGCSSVARAACPQNIKKDKTSRTFCASRVK